MSAPTCPYCSSQAQLVTGERIYPHRPDLFDLKFWCCDLCDAWVGCHKPGTHRVEGGQRIDNGDCHPLGRLANAELRRAKSAAHAAFDPLWKSRGLSRRQAYAWLSEQMGLDLDRTHIGEFDVAQCNRVFEICRGAVIPLATPSGPAPGRSQHPGGSPRQGSRRSRSGS